MNIQHPLMTLYLTDSSRSGMVRILILFAQPSQHFVRVRSLSLCPRPNVDIARATTYSTLRVSRVGSLSCRAVQILTWFAQPSWHFVRVRSLSLWRGANFCRCFGILARGLRSSLEAPIATIVQRVSWTSFMHEDVDQVL